MITDDNIDRNNEINNFQLSDFEHSEYTLDEIVEAEVVNPSCIYFGETVWVTHKAYSLDVPWYKAELGYEPCEKDGYSVWFKEDELEFI